MFHKSDSFSPTKIHFLISILLACSLSYAADAAKLEIFMTTNSCKYCDLTDANFADKNLRGADFENANIGGANMAKADLSEKPLEKRTLATNFQSANLKKLIYQAQI